MVRVSVSYDLSKVDGLRDMDAVVEEAIGQQAEDSGSGFGARDLGFYFDTVEEAENAAAAASTLPEVFSAFVVEPEPDE